MPMPRNTEEDFWLKVNRDGPIHPVYGQCWVWIPKENSKGYGYFSWGDKSFKAHRVSWMLTFGDIPDGLCVLHRCDNPSCVNPKHLFLGTNQDNADDCVAKGRQTKGEDVHLAKLTEIDVRIIRRLFKEGMSLLNLARMFDCHKTNVASIVKGRTWKHVL